MSLMTNKFICIRKEELTDLSLLKVEKLKLTVAKSMAQPATLLNSAKSSIILKATNFRFPETLTWKMATIMLLS